MQTLIPRVQPCGQITPPGQYGISLTESLEISPLLIWPKLIIETETCKKKKFAHTLHILGMVLKVARTVKRLRSHLRYKLIRWVDVISCVLAEDMSFLGWNKELLTAITVARVSSFSCASFLSPSSYKVTQRRSSEYFYYSISWVFLGFLREYKQYILKWMPGEWIKGITQIQLCLLTCQCHASFSKPNSASAVCTVHADIFSIDSTCCLFLLSRFP